MANPTTRAELIEYCKRRLGDPVIEINVDDDQVEDRVDEALQYYQEFHSDATVRTFLKHLVTAADVTNKYIPISSDVIFVSRLFPMTSSFAGGHNFFGMKYQMMLNNIHDLQTFAGDLAYYEQLNQYLSTLDFQLNGTPQVTFQRHADRLHIHGDFQDDAIVEGAYLVAEVFQTVDPDQYTSVYNDMWLKEYTTSLIKEQWGQNLIKFEGMQLPGGVTINGRQIYDDAKGEIEQLRERIRLEQELPADFFVG